MSEELKTQAAAPAAPASTETAQIPGNHPSFSEMAALADAEMGSEPATASEEPAAEEPAADPVGGMTAEAVEETAPGSSVLASEEAVPEAEKSAAAKPAPLLVNGIETTPEEVGRVVEWQKTQLSEAMAQLKALQSWKEEQEETRRLEEVSQQRVATAYAEWRLGRRDAGLSEDVQSFYADMDARGVDFSPKKPAPKQLTQEQQFEQWYEARKAKEAGDARANRIQQIQKATPSLAMAEIAKHPALKAGGDIYVDHIEKKAGELLKAKGFSVQRIGDLTDAQIQGAIAEATAITAKRISGMRIAETGALLDDHAKQQKKIPVPPKNGAAFSPRRVAGMDFDVDQLANQNGGSLKDMLNAAKTSTERELSDIRRMATDKTRR